MRRSFLRQIIIYPFATILLTLLILYLYDGTHAFASPSIHDILRSALISVAAMICLHWFFLGFRLYKYKPLYFSINKLVDSALWARQEIKSETKKVGIQASSYVEIAGRILRNAIFENKKSFREEMFRSHVFSFTSSNPVAWYHPTYLGFLMDCKKYVDENHHTKLIPDGYNAAPWYKETLRSINTDSENTHWTMIRVFLHNESEINTYLTTIFLLHDIFKIPYVLVDRKKLILNIESIKDRKIIETFMVFLRRQMGIDDSSLSCKVADMVTSWLPWKTLGIFRFHHFLKKAIKSDSFLDFAAFSQNGHFIASYFNNTQNPLTEDDTIKTVVGYLLDFILDEWDNVVIRYNNFQ